MKYHLSVFLLTSSYFICRALPNDRAGRVVGGNEAVAHSQPYIVSIQVHVLWIRAHVCGGSILNEYWVLTAGHCVDNFFMRWLPLEAIAGAHDVDNFGPDVQALPIREKISHPLYNGGIDPHDIAVLKTKTPFLFNAKVQPIALPPHDFKTEDVNSEVILTGWGAIKSGFFLPEMPDKLREVRVPLLSYEDCYKAISAISEPNEVNPLDRNSHICTGPLSGGIAACSGDSGGPLVQLSNAVETDDNADSTNEQLPKYMQKQIDLNTSKPTVVGIVSWGVSPCGSEGAPSVYTKVSSYLDFINSHINEK